MCIFRVVTVSYNEICFQLGNFLILLLLSYVVHFGKVCIYETIYSMFKS